MKNFQQFFGKKNINNNIKYDKFQVDLNNQAINIKNHPFSRDLQIKNKIILKVLNNIENPKITEMDIKITLDYLKKINHQDSNELIQMIKTAWNQK